MNQVEFERLSRSLMGVIRQVKDEKSLLRIACALLGAEVAILLKRQSLEDRNPSDLYSVYPSEYQNKLKANPEVLWRWYDPADPLQGIDGFVKEGPLSLAEQEFPDVLVAFGKRQLDKEPPRCEIILLKVAGHKEIYRSYHCWAAANLLRQYEFYYQLDKETRLKKQYAASLSEEVLPEESWHDIKERMEDKEAPLRWLNYVIWTSYQVRRLKTGILPADELEMELKEDDKDISPGLKSFFQLAIKFLLSREDFNKKSELFKNFKNELLTILETPFSDELDDLSWVQLKVLILERAWENIRQNALRIDTDDMSHPMNSSIDIKSEFYERNNFSEMLDSTKHLLRLTRGLVIHILTTNGLKKWKSIAEANGNSHVKDFQELSRGYLRFYLATELAKPSSRLEQLYLEGEKETERRKAPRELRRTFILNLSRFMLSVIALLQERVDLETDPLLVSPSEELDCLLYIIDRYAHVELEIDERLNFREHLGQQISAEVHHHLTRPHYRDHLLHVIDVFLLGHLLLNTRVCWLQGETIPLVEHLTRLASRKKNNGNLPTLAKEWMQNWAVASLLHDIGYQLGQGKSISHEPDAWKKYFLLTGPVDTPWLEFQKERKNGTKFNGLNNQLFEFAENLLSKIPEIKELCSCITDKNEEIILDHGVLSALRVAQLLFHADPQGWIDKKAGTSELATHYNHAIHAIAHHNLFKFHVAFDSHPLSCLLRLCDELQEWGRRRVNIEKVVKDLYLDIQEGYSKEIPTYEMFSSFRANLRFERHPKDGLPDSMEVSVDEDHKHGFRFILTYHDSVKAYFDPTMTLLCKAYNLQHLDMAFPEQGQNDLKFSIELRFPSPQEYGDLTEYDIYGLFTEEVRSLPLLRQFESIRDAEGGLIRFKPEAENKLFRGDCFGIIVTRATGLRNRHGWLPTDPGYFFDGIH